MLIFGTMALCALLKQQFLLLLILRTHFPNSDITVVLFQERTTGTIRGKGNEMKHCLMTLLFHKTWSIKLH